MTDNANDAPDIADAPLEPGMPAGLVMPVNLPPVQPRMDAIFSIPVTVEVVLASVKMPVSKLMDIQAGSEIDLDHPAGAEVALVVNGSRIAFGHLFLINPPSKRVGVRISRLATTGPAV
jgi:flagellar motor switch protein FliN